MDLDMNDKSSISANSIVEYIYVVRGAKVMLDQDLAVLYEVQTKVLKQAVRRNIKRFPDDFMYELTKKEYQSLRSQTVTLKRGQHSKYLPFAFTEQGIAMLSGILTSERAIAVNIEIMRAFIQLRSIAFTVQKIEGKINELEKKYNKNFAIVFEALRQLIQQKNEPRKQIGFKSKENEPKDKF
jgi:hypothetical protein